MEELVVEPNFLEVVERLLALAIISECNVSILPIYFKEVEVGSLFLILF